MDNTIKIVSINCRGLALKSKRKEIMSIWRKQKISIICLQDIHIAKGNEAIMKNEWGLQAIIAPYKSNSRGVAILFNNNFTLNIFEEIKDPAGNYIITDIDVDDIRLTLVNIYAPNIDDPDFFY
jgi:exonuclease III